MDNRTTPAEQRPAQGNASARNEVVLTVQMGAVGIRSLVEQLPSRRGGR